MEPWENTIEQRNYILTYDYNEPVDAVSTLYRAL